MASRPSLYPYWASTTTNLIGTGNTNKVRPKTSLQNIGWDLGQQPTCEEFNWQLNNIDQWVEYLDSVVYAATPSDTANTLSLRDSNGSFAVKQLTSTAPVGTKPFNVTSTTKVDNLNADLLDGMTTTSAATVSTVAARDINGNTSFNRVLLGDGSAANPSLTFTSDGATDTGLYHSVDGIINITVNGTDTGSFKADGLHMSVKGNADTSSKWSSARNLSFTGFANGNGNIDGSGNVSIALTVGSGFSSSKTQNGWAYRPDGLIEQWGWIAGGEDTVLTVTLPITFPNNILNLSCTARSPNTGSSGNTDLAAHGDIINNSTIVVIITSSSGAYTGTNGVFWRVIGY